MLQDLENAECIFVVFQLLRLKIKCHQQESDVWSEAVH